jgi:DNA-binding PucR family transcriptional regulator
VSTLTRGSELIARCSEEFRGGMAEHVATIAEGLADLVPELRADEDVFREALDAIAGNAAVVLSIFVGVAPPEDRVSPEQLRLTRTLRRRGMTLDRLVFSYRAGENVFWRLWLGLLAARAETKDDLLDALQVSSAELHGYLDRSLEAVMREYEADRERRAGRALARRIALVQRILRGDQIDAVGASDLLAYDLRRQHTGLVIWGDPEGDAAREAAASEIASALDAEAMLLLPAGDTSLWVWLAGVDDGRLSAGVEHRVHLEHSRSLAAAGRSCHGAGGFRDTHRQALRAQGVAAQMPDPPTLTLCRDVEIAALMGGDRQALREFVAAHLGPLGARTPAAARLRETLTVYLEDGANATRAAERLHTHKNTVRYRIQRAEETLGRPITEDRLGLELALRVVQILGEVALPSGE